MIEVFVLRNELCFAVHISGTYDINIYTKVLDENKFCCKTLTSFQL